MGVLCPARMVVAEQILNHYRHAMPLGAGRAPIPAVKRVVRLLGVKVVYER